MFYAYIITRGFQSYASKIIRRQYWACQCVFHKKIHTVSKAKTTYPLSRLRYVDVQYGSSHRRILREVGFVNEAEAQRIKVTVLTSVIKKLLSPLFGVFHYNRHRGMYDSQSLKPPEGVRGMKTLDVDAFKKVVLVPGIRVPNQYTGPAVGKLKGYLLKMPGIRAVAEVKESDPEHQTHKLFLLDPEKVKSIDLFLKEQENILNGYDINTASVKLYELELCYKNWTHHEILRAVLPQEYDGVAGFSSIGHILHLNLKNEIIDYKHIIGRVLLDKIPTARTVVNKLDIIDSTFRNFEMEVLAGESDFVTVTKENGLRYKLDFSKVYWNPRLGTEHQRVVSLLRPHDVVLDVFAGIGPFAVPAAKKGCTVYANDLNPHSYYWLQENLTLNKVKGAYETYNMDGREFIRTVVKEKLVHHWSQESPLEKNVGYHIIMNLPAMAVQFLDAFHGLFDENISEQQKNWPSYSEPQVYCYAFTKAENGEKDVVEQAEKYLGSSLGTDHVVRFVRQVAPNKEMFCVMFKPSRELLFDSVRNQQSTDAEPPAKKVKTELDES